MRLSVFRDYSVAASSVSTSKAHKPWLLLLFTPFRRDPFTSALFLSEVSFVESANFNGFIIIILQIVDDKIHSSQFTDFLLRF